DAGARPQRLVLAAAEPEDHAPSDVPYIGALTSPFTVITLSEGALKALADHGDLGAGMPSAGGDCEAVLAGFGRAGVDIDALAGRLQNEAAAALVKSWIDLMSAIASKSAALTQVF
ncbi:hypothetical protein, partial [Desulfococcus sp.]|uniref:hypothetical protein n=1 Tax=Desulfococcus sp. TaxID=2025834 RepID=UPI003593A7DB